MAASRFKIDNLVGIVDCNKLQASGPTRDVFDIPDIAKKWEAFGWHVLEVDGHDVRQIAAALDAAEAVKGRPTLIVANTVKGKFFSFAEHNAAFHNGILTEELYATAKADLDRFAAHLAGRLQERAS